MSTLDAFRRAMLESMHPLEPLVDGFCAGCGHSAFDGECPEVHNPHGPGVWCGDGGCSYCRWHLHGGRPPWKESIVAEVRDEGVT